MSISSSEFSLCYIIFLAIGIFERIVFTFFNGKMKAGRFVYHRWIFFTLFISFIFIIFFSIVEYFLIPKVTNLTISLLGFFIFIAGILLRRKSYLDLGKNWSLYIEIKDKHELITSGIYKFIKHPYCLSVIFELIGVCLIPNSFYSLLLIFLIQLPLLIYRVTLEEKVLSIHFGNEYKKYTTGKIM